LNRMAVKVGVSLPRKCKSTRQV